MIENKKRIEQGRIIYEINSTEKTASIYKSNFTQGDITIPRSINYNKNEYVVTSILYEAFGLAQIKSITFSKNYELQTIESEAFKASTIERFTIPIHVTKIGDCAFSYCKMLKRVEIPANSELRIIGKSVFSNSSIESFTIPPHLTSIGDFAFSFCKRLQQIEIKENAELKSIGRCVFFSTPIKSFFIPSTLIEIKEGWSQELT